MTAFGKACYGRVEQGLFCEPAAGNGMCAQHRSSSHGYSWSTVLMAGNGLNTAVSQKRAQSPSAQSVLGSTLYVVHAYLSPSPASHIVLLHRLQRPARLVMVLQQHGST